MEHEKLIESMSGYYNVEFTTNQKKLIEVMLKLNSESISEFYGVNAPDDYKTFLRNHRFSSQQEEVINNILKSNKDLNPNTDEGFQKPKLKELEDEFNTCNIILSSMPQRPSSHMTTKTRSSINKKKSAGKTKKEEKNKKKKRKSYKK